MVLAASYEAKARGIRTAMSGHQARAPVSAGDRGAAADVGVLRGQQGGVPRVRRHLAAGRGALDRRGVSRRARHASGSPVRRVEIATRLRAAVLERVGLPITVGIARTKFLAKVASGVAKPDGLLVVPPGGELAFLHPLDGRAAVGCRPRDRRRSSIPVGSRTVGDVAQARRGRSWFDCSAVVRDGTCTRWRTTAIRGRCRPAGGGARSGAQRALGRGRRSPAEIDSTLITFVDRVTRRMRAADGSGTPSSCGFGSTTSPARPDRTPCRTPRPRPR